MHSVGVIVARFQVPELHIGHQELIEFVRARHPTILVILGSTGKHLTAHDPLPFCLRKAMVLEAYPQTEVCEMLDSDPPSPAKWSKDLDLLLRDRYPDREIVLYGSRDSFLAVYNGTFPTYEVTSATSTESGTKVRATTELPSSLDARKALIWAMREMTQKDPPIHHLPKVT